MEILIPLKKKIIHLLLLILATIFWIIILNIIIHYALIIPANLLKYLAFLSVIVWFILGLAGTAVFIWLFFGRERIIVTADYFITEKPLIFFYRRNFYPISEISNIKVDFEVFKINRNNTWIEEKRMVISLETPNKHIVIARGITSEDAEYILFQLLTCQFINKQQFAIVHY